MAPKSQLSKEQQIADLAAADYTSGMFEDGHNRTETNKKAHDAPLYDKAAHRIDPDLADMDVTTDEAPLSAETFHSRDGTDAAGELDEWGGSLGGTEKELDDLEATAAPVDRTPNMKA